MKQADATQHYNPDPERLRALIRSAGLTQGTVARLAGVNVRTIERALAGDAELSYPLQFTIEAICAGQEKVKKKGAAR